MVSLVVVESPAKAKTLARFLGPGYVVEASYGHIRDLPESADQIPARVKKQPWARLGVNVEQDFEPLYVIADDKKRHVKRLKDALRLADRLLLATDEDREGESISWHVVEVLAPDVPVERITFHEITAEAIREAVEHPRAIDDRLVRAQEGRRIVDRLFGYQLSPLLWKKVRAGLSAGRVQSVAVRLCVERERERSRFVSAVYWDAEADLEVAGQRFRARLVRVGDGRVATGQDFDPDTGDLKKASRRRSWLRTREEVEALVAAWGRPWTVSSVEEKKLQRSPAPPFTTSSLQQEANRKLGFTARHTMRVAQRLYEGIDLGGDLVGLITYMRTDSLTLSRKALADAQSVIRATYGDDFTEGPRQYRTQAKGAQEAHEAIRPTEISRRPESVRAYLGRDELRLYELVWKRTVASQMAKARLARTSVELTAPGETPGVFAATGTAIEFPGFLRAYVEGSDDPAAELADREVILPLMKEGEEVDPTSVESQIHETAPPARYTEASLVKKLEAEGIGRPSTYAAIIETIQNRGYVFKQRNALVPTFTAVAVTQLLENHFPSYVDLSFTARMEEQLDDVAAGRLDWKEHLRQFYFGNGDEAGLEGRIEREADRIEYPVVPVGEAPESGRPYVVRIGRYGPYLQHEDDEGERLTVSLPADTAPAEFTPDEARKLLEQARKGATLLGHDEDGLPIYLARGRFGPYVQLGDNGKTKPKRASVPKGTDEESVDLPLALKLLSLPRVLGSHPESGEEVLVARGRFGPFVKCGTETRSLTPEDDVYTVPLERVLELLAQPKGGRGRRTRTVLRELGADAKGAKVELLEGPYGPYVTNGELNAGLPKGQSVEALSLEAALQLLAERGKAPRRGRGRKKTKK